MKESASSTACKGVRASSSSFPPRLLPLALGAILSCRGVTYNMSNKDVNIKDKFLPLSGTSSKIGGDSSPVCLSVVKIGFIDKAPHFDNMNRTNKNSAQQIQKKKDID